MRLKLADRVGGFRDRLLRRALAQLLEVRPDLAEFKTSPSACSGG